MINAGDVYFFTPQLSTRCRGILMPSMIHSLVGYGESWCLLHAADVGCRSPKVNCCLAILTRVARVDLKCGWRSSKGVEPIVELGSELGFRIEERH